jgi:16S rRNA (cytidine1402-2'-O)-methyltransferase
MPGTLYVVATPLGNLGDLSPRAAEALRQAAVVAAEDTRRTRGLLSHLGASPTLLSFHAHSGERRVDTLLEILKDGRDLALVTDAGTPGVSDPGIDLVAAALEAGHVVVPIPGPSAVATALSAAGLPADRYLFLGFVPRKGTSAPGCWPVRRQRSGASCSSRLRRGWWPCCRISRPRRAPGGQRWWRAS